MAKNQITKKQARVSLENYLVEQTRKKANTLEIRDYRPGDEVGMYNVSGIENCFIVHVPDDKGYCIGASRMIAISKETGEILTDRMHGE
ncbi:hypothetical protein [Desulfobacula sp.]|uniref:hypothetical protein n=1 Tax=Desulfobacula sp. TaxID=2593537 RepID=UPI00261EF67F|nr:hypothetical protein [Desulfobacula sp.]